MRQIIDLVGQRFGNLVVLRLHRESMQQSGKTRWLCCCDCGRECNVLGERLRLGRVRSCGCSQHAVKNRPTPPTPPHPPHMNNLIPTPIGALSDRLTDVLLDAVHGLPDHQRLVYLAMVSDELLAVTARPITISIVERACYTVAQRMRSKGRLGNDEDDRLLVRRLA